MSMIEQQVADAEILAEYVRRNGIAVAGGTLAVIAKARSKLPGLRNPGQDNTDFVQALADVSAAVPVPPASLTAAVLRQRRLAPIADDAQILLEYAAANAKKVDDDNRKLLLASIEAVNKGTPTLENQQTFFKSYEALTQATTPVTADTIEASQTRLPTLQDFLRSKEDAWKSWDKLTLGRFCDAIVFILVLILTGFALGYNTTGSDAAKRLKDVDTQFATTMSDVAKNEDLVRLRKASLDQKKAKQANADPTLFESDQKALDDASRDLVSGKALMEKLKEERATLPARLWLWSQQPCGVPIVTIALCSTLDAVPKGAEPKSDLARVAAADTVLSWLNRIFLPMLLGLLGSHAFVIRKMTSDITAMTFAKASTLRHITRLALGALAGIASGWLLPPETVSTQLKNTPAWVLAFVAGYGIELVFAFLDKIIGAFTSKSP
jgi:hypothetical protein